MAVLKAAEEPERFLTIAEVARHLRISESLAYCLVAEKRLPAIRLGRRGKRGAIRVEEDALRAFVEQTRDDLADD